MEKLFQEVRNRANLFLLEKNNQKQFMGALKYLMVG